MGARVRDRLAFIIGKAILAGMRLFGKDGYHVPGQIAHDISRTTLNFIDKPTNVIFVSGTSGKSTTTALVRHILTTAGRRVAFNTESNTQPGIISALLRNTSVFNRTKADALVLEVAEEAIRKISAIVKPQYLLLTNIQKDTFQVNLSPNYVYDMVASAIDDSTTLIVNNDDPRVLSLGAGRDGTVTYGVAPNRYTRDPDLSQYAVTQPCSLCQGKIAYDYTNIPSIGKFHCMQCGFGSRETPDYLAADYDLDLETITIGERTFPMHYQASHFAYDYVLAYALAKQLGIDDDTIAQAFDSFVNIGGRLEEEVYHGVRIHYARFKQETPDTLQCSINYIHENPDPKTVVLSLNLVDNDVWGPLYTETFYTYDCDFTVLADSNVERFICAGRAVAHDTANRLVYAGVPRDKITIVDSDDPHGFLDILKRDQPERAYVLAYLGYYKKVRKAINES